MILAIASGKGGTGKTTLAAALATVAAARGGDVRLLDCDVEEPDAALGLDVRWLEERSAGLPVPVVDAQACSGCGACADACAFGALAAIPGGVVVLEHLCHGCGRCLARCPTGALSERFRETGRLRRGTAGPLVVAEGRLHVGEAMATPILRQLAAWQLGSPGNAPDLVILDAPPGTSCPLVATLAYADRVLLVAESTPFGLHDLTRAATVARDVLGRPVTVVLNRDDGLDEGVAAFCRTRDIPLLLTLPFDRRVARAAARGEGLLDARPDLRPALASLLDQLTRPLAAEAR